MGARELDKNDDDDDDNELGWQSGLRWRQSALRGRERFAAHFASAPSWELSAQD